jgi:hypothetical protein
MSIPTELFSQNGEYMLELDKNNNPVAVYKKYDPQVYVESADSPKGEKFDSSWVIEVIRTGNTYYCWYKTSTGAYIKVPC